MGNGKTGRKTYSEKPMIVFCRRCGNKYKRYSRFTKICNDCHDKSKTKPKNTTGRNRYWWKTTH